MRAKDRMEYQGSKAEGRFAIVWLVLLTAGVELIATLRRAFYFSGIAGSGFLLGRYLGFW